MKLHVIFRDKEGQLTFKLQPQVAYTVYARSKENAQEMLERLANNEKQEEDNAISEE